MTIEELCAKFDSSLVVDSGELLNKIYKSSSDKIYTDGDILNTKIDNNGNIVIEGLNNATYIAILDSNEKTYLAVYEYISNPSIFEQIYSAFYDLKQYKEKLFRSKQKIEVSQPEEVNISLPLPKDVYDIRNFKCPFCGDDGLNQIIVNQDHKTNLVDIKCTGCDSIFNLVPSTYYRLVSYTKPWKG